VNINDFNFELPAEQIAQRPLDKRDASRLMVLDRRSGRIEHRRFLDLSDLLRPSDLLVVNETRVIAARLIGKRIGTGGRVELLVVRPVEGGSTEMALEARGVEHDWFCLAQSGKPLRPGAQIEVGAWRARVLEVREPGTVAVRFTSSAAQSLAELLEQFGHVPLPPYIRREPDPEDRRRYQTVFAATPGSVAAPTAGLHFTHELLAQLQARGVERIAITLDVGPGTFLPVRVENLEEHKMHPERYEVPAQAADRVFAAKSAGSRVVAVGTTVVRALEAAADPTTGKIRAGANETNLFIRPGFQFRVVDALLTNFHLPRSTLIVMVSAFCGRELTLRAYREAVVNGYRFFSYGDAMLIT